MNIHEHQAKQILKDYGAPVSNGVEIFSISDIDEKIKKLNTKGTNTRGRKRKRRGCKVSKEY